ncbi:MAG: phospho-N-acetylmuramoyl-pentapeptide-transferase [Planctomycetes bacterium]|nr:phospho-N-acetylmuramoyl-pentapeptide-transferase [Planctomycetota bacterium]MDA0948803.1 phospho-N-acetylmuramoyl-pentapeptide-transferase [Planctomycetota bacterium]
MLIELLNSLMGVSLFGYISFRVVMAVMTGFALALVLGGPVIRWLAGQRIGERSDKNDLAQVATVDAGKAGTPTMGGSFLIAALLGSALLWCRLDNVHVVLGLILVAGLAAVGFVDDWIKLTDPDRNGLSPTGKIMGQLVIGLFVVGAMAWTAHASDRYSLLAIHPPFAKDWTLELGNSALGVALFVAIGWVVVAGTSNAINITDGMDGLAAGCTILAAAALAVFCYVTGRWDWTGYLGIPHVPEASEMTVLAGALIGATTGFLWFNAPPARVFMGDSGALPLGGLLGWMALVSKQEVPLGLIALVPFAELGSSALQRFSYRTTGRRVFTIAPLHHGLKEHGGVFRRSPSGGIPETTVVVRLWIVAALSGLASLALLKVR